RKNLVVPLDTGLSRDQVMLLVEALEARPELEELAAQSPPGPAADGVDPKLEELAKRFPPKTADRVRRLGELLAGGNIWLETEEGVTRITASEQVSESVRIKDRSDRAVKELLQLIDDRFLLRDGCDGEKMVWKINPARLR